MKQERYRQLRHGARKKKTVCLVCKLPIEAGKLADHSNCVSLQLHRRKGASGADDR